MKTPAFVIALLFASIKKVKASCYSVVDGNAINNCACHESCGTCGYNLHPTSDSECITCTDGLELYPEYDDGTGYCKMPGVEACYEYQYSNDDPIEGCQCHNTCGTGCGYSDDPTGEDDCIDCADGLELSVQYDDGTGSCRIPGPELCYEDYYDEEQIDGCMCHHTCGTACGYTKFLGEPCEFKTKEAYDCLDCAEGLELFEVWYDGTGYCLEPSVCLDNETFEPRTDDSCICQDNCAEC